MSGLWLDVASAIYIEFFGWIPTLGRRFTNADAASGAPRVVLVSHDFWRNALGSRADVVGTTLRLDGEPATVVGVLPRMVVGGGIFVPLQLDASTSDHDARSLFVFARMRDGVSIQQVRGEMEQIAGRLERDFARTNRGWTINTRPLQEEFLGPQARVAFAILAMTVVSVLLIGCVNIANLLLARGFARRGELAVRVALGAAGWRIARQLLIECGVLAAADGAASLIATTMRINRRFRTCTCRSRSVRRGPCP